MLFSFLTQSKYSFDDKLSYEKVVTLLYRHWWVLFAPLLFYIFLALLPFIVYAVIRSYIPEGLGSVYWFLVSAYFLFWWTSLFYRLTMYLLDIWIVTDHRIIDSEQHGFFNRSVAELHLARIQDISVVIGGTIPTLLDFGNLEVQSAGTEPKFFFKQVPHPTLVKDTIMHCHNRYMNEHPNEIEVHEQGPDHSHV